MFSAPKKLHNLFVLINVEYGTSDKEYVLLYFKPFDHSTIQTKKVILKKKIEACKTKNSKNTRFHFFFFHAETSLHTYTSSLIFAAATITTTVASAFSFLRCHAFTPSTSGYLLLRHRNIH